MGKIKTEGKQKSISNNQTKFKLYTNREYFSAKGKRIKALTEEGI
jgi:hypothetical protein